MNPTKHFVVALDFTPSCRRALREGLRRARSESAQLTAVHVLDPFLVHELKKALAVDELAIRAEWLARLQKFIAESAGTEHEVNAEVRVESAFDGLMDACHVHRASLLLMGSCGTGSGEHRLGVVAASCVRRSPVDVLVVRETAPEPFQNVLACVDYSPNSVKALRRAFELAKADGATLHCLFVYQSPLALAMSQGGFVTALPPIPDETDTAKHWRECLDHTVDPIAAEFPGVTVKKLVDERLSIRDAILDTAAQVKADLVVLGTRGRNTLRHLLIGTTAERIIQHAPCSILTMRPDEEAKA